LQSRLKQNGSQIHKRAIFLMNRENRNCFAISPRAAKFYRSRLLALGAAV